MIESLRKIKVLGRYARNNDLNSHFRSFFCVAWALPRPIVLHPYQDIHRCRKYGSMEVLYTRKRLWNERAEHKIQASR